MRWNNYILNDASVCTEFWKDYLSVRREMLYILGVGFDPRTLNGIQNIYGIDGQGKRDVLSVRYFQSENDQKQNISNPAVGLHERTLHNFLETVSDVTIKQVNLVTRSEQKSIASIKAYDIINDLTQIKEYTDVIVDISAMPRGVFIPLLHKLLSLIDSDVESNINLHVIATENYKLDARIEDEGLEQSAEYIHGLSIRDIKNTADYREVWIAILGEKQLDQYDKIRSSVNPVSTCVILPFPSKNLRRGDELIDYYQDKLIHDNDFDMKNIIYVDEQNPFQVYRLIRNTIDRHSQSLAIFGGTKIIVSALSSKLLTIGAFLAVYETKLLEKEGKNLRVGIKHVDSINHKFEAEDNEEELLSHNQLFHMWIAGSPYKLDK